MNKPVLMILALYVTGLFTGCGDSSISGNSDDRMGSDKTRLTLKVTDAPIDNITEVWIQFSAIELKPSDADSIRFELTSPMTINLLSLTGAKSAILLDNVIVPSGDYDWIRLAVNATRDGVKDSYVRLLDGSEPELNIPGGSTSGLQLNGGFTADSTTTQMTVDFDLRKSIAVTGSDRYQFRPVLKLIDDSISGTISGTINTSLLTEPNCSDDNADTGNAVYVFSGNNITPDDIDNVYPDPYTTTTISYNTNTEAYEYEVGFLPEGSYTVAFTCQSDQDELNSSESISFSIIRTNVTVTSSEEINNTFR